METRPNDPFIRNYVRSYNGASRIWRTVNFKDDCFQVQTRKPVITPWMEEAFYTTTWGTKTQMPPFSKHGAESSVCQGNSGSAVFPFKGEGPGVTKQGQKTMVSVIGSFLQKTENYLRTQASRSGSKTKEANCTLRHLSMSAADQLTPSQCKCSKTSQKTHLERSQCF